MRQDCSAVDVSPPLPSSGTRIVIFDIEGGIRNLSRSTHILSLAISTSLASAEYYRLTLRRRVEVASSAVSLLFAVSSGDRGLPPWLHAPAKTGENSTQSSTLEHSNSRFKSIRFVIRIDSSRFVSLKNRPFDSRVVMQFLH